MNYNKIIFAGNLVADPELLNLKNSTTNMVKFRVASNYERGDYNNTCFIDVVTFGNTAAACFKYLEKGRCVLVEGRLSRREYLDKEGNKRSKYEINANKVEFVGNNRNNNNNLKYDPPLPKAPAGSPLHDEIDDDIPF